MTEFMNPPPMQRARVVTPNTSLVCLSGVPQHDLAKLVVLPPDVTARRSDDMKQAGLANTVSASGTAIRDGGSINVASARSAAHVAARDAPPADSQQQRQSTTSAALESLAAAARPAPLYASSSHSLTRNDAPVTAKTGRWTKREDLLLRHTVSQFGDGHKDWKSIAAMAFNGARSDAQCHERWEKVLKLGLVKGPWTPEEDEIVRQAVDTSTRKNGGNSDLVNWAEVAKLLPGRLTKQVRERWQNHLNPALIKSPWTEEEDYLLVSLQAVLGNRWNEIARAFQGRSENAIKNRWNSKQRRTLLDAQNNAAQNGGGPVKPDHVKSILPTSKNVCRNVNFHKALVKATGNDPEINEAASILVNKVSRCVAVQ